MSHALTGGQASDQASKRTPGRYRLLRSDKSLERHPTGHPYAKSQTKNTDTNLTRAPDGTPNTVTVPYARLGPLTTMMPFFCALRACAPPALGSLE
jgi:hypothetical protein